MMNSSIPNENDETSLSNNQSTDNLPKCTKEKNMKKHFSLMQWQKVDDVRDISRQSKLTPTSTLSSILTTNSYRELILDDESNFDEEYNNLNIISKPKTINETYGDVAYKGRPTVVVKENPEKDDPLLYKSVKHFPGNSTYASISKHGKKVAILSDSICRSIRMKEFNDFVKNGYTYRKTYPGATINELAHYCLKTLKEDNPDTCILNIGNNLRSHQPNEIYKGIVDLLNICHNHGVNDVYVSAIPLRIGQEKTISEINNFPRTKTFVHNYILIDNSNINHNHISKGNVHLNYEGTIVLANNFIRAINGKRTG